MAEKTLKEKVGWKPGQRVLVAGLPEGMISPFVEVEHTAVDLGAKLPEKSHFDLLLGFARDQAALRELAPMLLGAASEDAKLWVSYPKGTSKITTDLNRDAGWGPLFDAGWIVVAIASVDSTWSAVRFRPRHLVKSVRF